MIILGFLLFFVLLTSSAAEVWKCPYKPSKCIFFNVKFDGHGSVKINISQPNEKLEFMEINSLYLKKVPANDLQKFVNLKIFELKNSLLEELASETMKFGRNLAEIRMSQNTKLRRISSNTFSYQQNLNTLHIDGSNLTDLVGNAFGGLYELSSLSLCSDQIETLHENLFFDLLKLTNLALADNKIKILPEFLFKNNKDLRVINLHSNSIVQAHSEMFKNLTKLTNLNLMGNSCVDKTFKNATEIQRGIAECHLNIYRNSTQEPNTSQLKLAQICVIILAIIIILLILITHLLVRSFKVII
jgi:hypothetical protein